MLKHGIRSDKFAGVFDSQFCWLGVASKLDLVAGTDDEPEFTNYRSSPANEIETLSGGKHILFIRNLPAGRRGRGIFWQ